MLIAILGKGFIGSKLTSVLSKKFDVVTVGKKSSDVDYILDARNYSEVMDFFNKLKPDCVIDTIGLTSSVECEKNPKLAEELNYKTTKNISKACKKFNSKMIFLSSLYVFDGIKGNYKESNIPRATNEYARTKIMAEREVLKLDGSIIVRTELVYGYNGKGNGNNGVLDKILSGSKIEIGDPYQKRQPIFAEDLARIISTFIKKDVFGIFHAAGPEIFTTFYFLSRLESIIRKQSKIEIVDASKWLVKSPPNVTANIDKIKSLGISLTCLNDAIKIIKSQLSY